MFNFFKKAVSGIAPKRQKSITKELLEDILLESDVSYDQVEEIIYYMPPGDEVKRADVRRVLLAYFVDVEKERDIDAKPYVDLIFGINGAGKTTTIGKLAYNYRVTGNSVMLAAADTFRAAAIAQLETWAKNIKVQIVATKQGHDPSAVAYDAITSATAKDIDHVIIDTAGRLHTGQNLSKELQKIVRICGKAKSGAPHRKILILDGTQGNSAINQAKSFNEIVSIDALIITKLDGTAKGGALFTIASELKKPIIYVGVGENRADLIKFNKEDFVDSLLDEIFENEG